MTTKGKKEKGTSKRNYRGRYTNPSLQYVDKDGFMHLPSHQISERHRGSRRASRR